TCSAISSASPRTSTRSARTSATPSRSTTTPGSASIGSRRSSSARPRNSKSSRPKRSSSYRSLPTLLDRSRSGLPDSVVRTNAWAKPARPLERHRKRRLSRRRLVPQQRADALDRREIVVVADRPQGAAVRERLVHREVEACFDPLQTRAVERAASVLEGCASALRAAKRRPVRAFPEQQQLDAAVGRGFER